VFVLLKPPFAWNTLILWLAPIVLVLGAAALAARTAISSRGDRAAGVAGSSSALSAEEEAKLKAVLGKTEDGATGDVTQSVPSPRVHHAEGVPPARREG
jgi:hypothetical protein